MKIAVTIDHLTGAGSFKAVARHVADLERAGADQVWFGEPYGFDAVSRIGYLAAVTERIELGTSILPVYTRTPTQIALTAAGCDYVSEGRFNLGLGASGPQVVEGFHGVPYHKPVQRIIDSIEVCRLVWARGAPLDYQGDAIAVPLPKGMGTGLGKPLKMIDHPVRSRIPIWWASLKPRAVEATAALADGWLPVMFAPELWERVWGQAVRAGLARRDPQLGPLEIGAGGLLAIGEHLVGNARTRALDQVRPGVALYVGGMGAREKNFYTDVARASGYRGAADTVQDLYLAGRKDEAAAALPEEWLAQLNLVGPRAWVAERVAAYREAGVTSLRVRTADPSVAAIETLRSIVDEVA